MDVDKALEKVGGYKRWHIAVFVLLSLSSFLPFCQQTLSFVFIGWEPQYHCRVSLDVPLNESIPYEGGTIAKCQMFVNSSVDNTTTECLNGLEYYNDGYETIVTEFSLVCQNDYLSDFSQFIYISVQAFGDIASSYLVDRYGRKKIHIISTTIILVLGSTVSFSPNYLCFILLRALCGIFTRVGVGSGMTLLMELFGTKHRTVFVMACQFFWVVAYMFPVMISYIIKDWRTVQLVGSLSSLIWLIHIWILTESVPWLVVNKRFSEAEKTLQTMAKRNNIKVEKHLLKPIGDHEMFLVPDCEGYNNIPNDDLNDQEEKNSQNYKTPSNQLTSSVPLRELFCDPKLRLHLLISNIFWLANTMVYSGLSLISPSLGPNRFFNYVILGIAEVPAYLAAIYLAKRYGRKYPLMIMFLLTGVVMGIAAFVPKQSANGRDLTPVILTLALLGKFTITTSFSLKLIFVKELFPTNLRSSSGAWGSIGGTVGNTIGPIASYLVKRIFWVPPAIFAVSAIVAGLTTFLLPETMNKPLPLTTSDIYRLYYKETLYDKEKHNGLHGTKLKKAPAN